MINCTKCKYYLPTQNVCILFQTRLIHPGATELCTGFTTKETTDVNQPGTTTQPTSESGQV